MWTGSTSIPLYPNAKSITREKCDKSMALNLPRLGQYKASGNQVTSNYHSVQKDGRPIYFPSVDQVVRHHDQRKDNGHLFAPQSQLKTNQRQPQIAPFCFIIETIDKGPVGKHRTQQKKCHERVDPAAYPGTDSTLGGMQREHGGPKRRCHGGPVDHLAYQRIDKTGICQVQKQQKNMVANRVASP